MPPPGLIAPVLLGLVGALGMGSQDPLPREPHAVFAAPDAAPDGDGSRAHPFDSIEAARDHLRAWRSLSPGVDQDPAGSERLRPAIILLAGTWQLNATIELDARDEGLVLRAADGARPRLVGGLVLVEPQLGSLVDAELLARLPGDAARAAVRVVRLPGGTELHGPVRRGMGSPTVAIGSEVFIDGVALTRARWPNAGFARLGEVLDKGSIPRSRHTDVAPELRETGPKRGGRFRPAGVAAERLARWAQAEDVWAFGYWFHDWADEQLPIEAIDPVAGTIHLGRPHRYGLKAGTTFYVSNLIEELDAPGEYHFDRASGSLIFWPPEALAGAPTRIKELVVSTLGAPLLRVRGTRGLVLQGLTLEGTRGPAIVVEDGENVVIRNCRIANTGTDGVRLRGEGCAVLDCDIRNTGATGVDLAGGDRRTLRPARNQLRRTRVHGFGRVYRTYHPAVHLSGVGQIVTGNELAHAPHSAIIFGGNEHRIEGNEIFDVLRETGDSGAIYCGRDWTMHGTRISGNFIHHLGGTEGRWQNAIYLDDMASGIEVSNNVMWRCHWGMLIGGGRDLTIRDNAFIQCDLGLRFDARGVGWMAKNIADPRTSTLHKRLAQIPIESEPWASRYPTLSSYLDDRFGRPAGSRVEGNHFYATPFGSVVDRECVRVTDNQSHPAAPAWILGQDYVENGERLGQRVTKTTSPDLPNNLINSLTSHTSPFAKERR